MGDYMKFSNLKQNTYHCCRWHWIGDTSPPLSLDIFNMQFGILKKVRISSKWCFSICTHQKWINVISYHYNVKYVSSQQVFEIFVHSKSVWLEFETRLDHVFALKQLRLFFYNCQAGSNYLPIFAWWMLGDALVVLTIVSQVLFACFRTVEHIQTI